MQRWEGRVEVRRRTIWATLCDKDLDIYTANVICRSLGYGTAKEYALGTVYAHAMEDMVCYGVYVIFIFYNFYQLYQITCAIFSSSNTTFEAGVYCFHSIQRKNCFISVIEHLRIDKMHGKRKIFTKLSLENEKGSHLQTLF